jgi:lysophospholipase L1-like esterase
VGGSSAGSPGGGVAGSSGGASSVAGQGGTGGAGNAGGNAGGVGNVAGSAGTAAGAGAANQGWVGTWATAQQLTEDANEPPSPGLANNTLRQVLQVSLGGARVRLRFSNEYGNGPLTLTKVHCAVSAGGGAITASTDTALTFAGAASVTLQPKDIVFSDPADFTLAPQSKVAVSIQFGAVPTDITGHPGSRTTSYLQAGDGVASASLSAPATTDHWYVLSGLDVQATDSRSLVILGDSITDGRGSTTNGNDRWPDALATRLRANAATAKIGVLNLGIGGNSVLSGGLGPTAQARFDGDVLKQSGVKWLIVFEGVNDIGDSIDASVAGNLIEAYKGFVTKARGAGLGVFGATILPFKGHSYYSADHELARQTVNDWIRQAGNFDAVIDLDAAVRNPAQVDTLLSTYDQGDHLHLNPTGYKKLADSVNLELFK